MAENLTFTTLRAALRKGSVAPVTLLHGEEGYYIDQLAKQFEELVPAEERDFNLFVMYGADATPGEVMELCRRFPFGVERQVVIVREAQVPGAKWLNALAPYAANPTPTTALCICCRGQKAAGADFLKALRQGGGTNFEAVKLKDYALAPALSELITSQGLSVDAKALSMLCDFVGSDLSRLYNEVGKLTVALGAGARITPEVVERNIGISKEYNNFELAAALATRNEERTLRILRYFRANPKQNPPQATAPIIFNLFSNLLVAQYAPDKSDHGLMEALGFKWPGQLKDVKTAMGHFNAWETIEIIQALRRFDCASKGNGSRQDPYDLLFDLATRILHPMGAKGVEK